MCPVVDELGYTYTYLEWDDENIWITGPNGNPWDIYEEEDFLCWYYGECEEYYDEDWDDEESYEETAWSGYLYNEDADVPIYIWSDADYETFYAWAWIEEE